MAELNPGINALAGFTFQTKVFIAELSSLKKGQKINYEVGDDVSIKSKIDIDEWNGSFSESEYYSLFQVKRKNVDKSSSKKTLFNWLLSEPADNYTLIVASGYTVDDSFIKEKDALEIYNNLDGTKKKNSLEHKVYDKFRITNAQDEFVKKIKRIRERYTPKFGYNPDLEIIQNFESKLLKNKSDESTYLKRVKRLCNKIQLEIFSKADKKETYSISYDDLLGILEDIIINTNDENYQQDYYEFEKTISLFVNEEIKRKREYIQLKYCGFNDEQIIRYLTNELYYQDFRDYKLEHRHRTLINTIETEAVQNHEDAKMFLNNPEPLELFKETIRNKIINTTDRMQSNGTYISLTSDNDKRISWKE